MRIILFDLILYNSVSWYYLISGFFILELVFNRVNPVDFIYPVFTVRAPFWGAYSVPA